MSDQPLSNDPEESLRMENELLRLKLTAELGAESHNIANIDPEIENDFLKHVLAFEQNYANAKKIKVYDRLGKPAFVKAIDLNDELLDQALQEVNDLLLQNSIAIDFSGEYDNRTKYQFITEELFEQEMDDFSVPGMMSHYIYEEFHPNHKLDIEGRAQEFLSGWFKQSLDKDSWELAPAFILPDNKVLPKNEVGELFKRIFDAYTDFTDEDYIINDVGFQLEEGGGLGHAGGFVKYTAILENGEKIVFNGPFKLYMELDTGWWSIFYAVFPGLVY